MEEIFSITTRNFWRVVNLIAQEVEVEFIPDMDDEDASKEPCLPVEPE